MKAYKFRLYPNKEQKKQMQTHFYLSKVLWNDMLELTKQTYKNYGKFSSQGALNELAKTSGLYSQVSQDIFKRLNKSIFGMMAKRKKGLKAGFPRFKGMNRIKSITYPQKGFSLKDKKLKVTPFGEINIKKHREINGKIKTMTLKKESSGKWFVIFTVEEELKNPRVNNGEQIGIDLGLMTFATLSNGEKIKNQKHLKKHEEKLAFYQRKLSKKKKRSKYCKAKNRNKAKIKVARQYEKVANTRRDYLHKLSTKFVNNYSLIALEKLKSKEMAEQQFGKSINDAGWGMFANMLSYKAEEAGCEVIFVNPKNTTKECSKCGELVNKHLWDRIHNCPSCGLSIDRDLNASINILKRATSGYGGSNACGDGAIVPSKKQEAQTVQGWEHITKTGIIKTEKEQRIHTNQKTNYDKTQFLLRLGRTLDRFQTKKEQIDFLIRMDNIIEKERVRCVL